MTFFIFSFSTVFYIDATNEQTLQADLEAITPGNVGQSASASLHWLAGQHERNWLLFFDNADDVNLKLKKFFPPCLSGNILVTTRNQELRYYSAKDADAIVTGMNHKDGTTLLLYLAQVEESNENKALAEAIVQVAFFYFCFFRKFYQTQAQHRNSITLLWPLLKLVLIFTFIVTHH